MSPADPKASGDPGEQIEKVAAEIVKALFVPGGTRRDQAPGRLRPILARFYREAQATGGIEALMGLLPHTWRIRDAGLDGEFIPMSAVAAALARLRSEGEPK